MTFTRFAGFLGVFAGLLLVGVAAGAAFFYFTFLRDLPDLRTVEDYRPPLSTQVYARGGERIGEFFEERRELVPLEEVPESVVHAFVAGEDSTFFEHSGIDFTSILRAAWVNLRAGGEIRQGGSTITQQVVKGLLLTPERKIRRKVREMILARRIEERFTKQEILYLYLNQIYFGHGAYGIGEAARRYFGKSVSELEVSEAALLAGLPKAPSRYSPLANPEEAERRRRYVLGRMHEDGFIDEAAYQRALANPPELAEPPEESEAFEVAAYFTEEVRRYLFEALGGERVLTGGLRVETTLDLARQRDAVEAVREGLVELDRRQGWRGPERRVAAGAVDEELVRLAEANGLAAPDAGAGDAAESGEPESEEAAADGPAEDAATEPTVGDVLLGVVRAVDAEAERAQVGFAPDLGGRVRLEDVKWAREPDPARRPRPVKEIEQIFAVGDVARFELLERTENGSGETLRLRIAQEPAVQGALLSFDVEDGDVLALVGGYDYAESQFNRAVQARRQPGSAFKPLIYGAAIEKGYTPASILFDRPVVYVDEESGFVWRPENYGQTFYGPLTLREALVRSINNATVHLFRDVGVGYVIDFARRMGIESPLSRDLSLALGSSGVSLLELTRAYAVFANGGRRAEPVFIRRVVDPDGEVLLANVPLGAEPPEEPWIAPDGAVGTPDGAAEPSVRTASTRVKGPEAGDGEGEPDRILPAADAYLVTDLLRAVVTDPRGTGRRARSLNRTVAGKTGTTNDQVDAWFVGFSPDVATGVWVGHDDQGRVLGWGETGARAALPIWKDYMEDALAGRPVRDFAVPDAIVFARIDRKTGLLADATSTETVFQPFEAGTEPTETDRAARTTSETRDKLRMDSF